VLRKDGKTGAAGQGAGPQRSAAKPSRAWRGLYCGGPGASIATMVTQGTGAFETWTLTSQGLPKDEGSVEFIVSEDSAIHKGVFHASPLRDEEGNRPNRPPGTSEGVGWYFEDSNSGVPYRHQVTRWRRREA
jgi:hypothetical protein